MSSPAPQDADAMHSEVLALYGQGRLAEAAQAAWRAVCAYPESLRAQYTYASVLRDCGQDREAMAVVEELLRRHHGAEALVLRGDLHRTLTGSYAAEADYLEALRLAPDNALAVHNLAVSRLRMGSLTRAVQGLGDAARLDPALASLALGNITLAVTRVLRWATASVVFPASALIVAGALRDGGSSAVLAGIAAVLLTLPLLVAIGWTVRNVPAPTLRAVLRRRWLLGVRLVFLGVAVAAGLITAFLGAAGFVGSLLLFGIVVVTVLGWISGG